MALNFDKTNSYNTGMTISGLGLTQSATVGFWVKRASTDTRCPIGNNSFSDGGDSDVLTFFYVSPSPWTRINTANTSNATINTGSWGTGWTHLLSTYDGSNYKLYINGTYTSQVAATGDLKSDKTTRSFYIGRRGTYVEAGNWGWFGDIAEFAIWKAVLSDGEIVSLAKGFCANRVRPQSLLTNSRLIRGLTDVKGVSTASGTIIAASHPAIYS